MIMHSYIGMWVTADGRIRHELLPNGRYDEARGRRKSAYQGNYKVTGNHIDYADDTGFTADGEFVDGVLYHAGMILYREQTGATNMTGQDNATLIRKLYDAVNRKDLATIASFGCAESEWLDVPFNFTSTGTSAIIDPWQAWFDIFPDATCEVRSLVAMGDCVVALGIGRGTQHGVFRSPAGELQPSGRAMHVHFCDVYRLKDGKIVRADSYFDFYGLLLQLAPKAERAA